MRRLGHLGGRAGKQRRGDASQPNRLIAQVVADQRVALGGAVALTEDQVEHLEHGGEPVGDLVGGRHHKGDAGVADLAFGAH